MRVTDFRLTEDQRRVVPEVTDAPAWKPFEQWEGESLRGVELVELPGAPGAEFQLVHIARGGHFVMHSSPKVAFCQVVGGSGTLGLPYGDELAYEGPELYVFRPRTLHEWRDVTADTLLSVCLVDQ